MNLDQLKSKIDQMKTDKAILISEDDKILTSLKDNYKIISVAQAKKEQPKVEKQIEQLENEKENLLSEAEEFLEGIE